MLRRNVLIFHSGALGDFVVSWPLALALGRIYAQSRIIYVTAGQKGSLAERALRIECTDVESGWHQLFSAACNAPANVQKMLAGSHAIFSFVAAEDSAWAKNVKQIAPQAKLSFIDPNPAREFDQHASQWLVSQLSGDPIVSTAVSQMLKSIGDRGLGVTPAPDGPILLHPGAGAAKKCWPRASFVSLAKRLTESGRSVRIILGDVERERWSEAEQGALADAATVVRPETLVDLYAALSGASWVIGNDSGPVHLAGIMGIPTLALFGPTDPNVWRPLGPKVRVVRAEPLASITVDQVTGQIV